jgi:hypothetical protein
LINSLGIWIMKSLLPSLTQSSESELFRIFPLHKPPISSFFLKDVIREYTQKEISEARLFNELLLFESKIDMLSLIAFNLYMQCREKIYELKANEMKNRTFRAFERAGLVSEMPADTPDQVNINICKEAPNDI